MQKWVVNKGQAGYDFNTLADTEDEAKDIAWRQSGNAVQEDQKATTMRVIGPFSWWTYHAKKWGKDKWYTVELSINPAVQAAPKQAAEFGKSFIIEEDKE